MSSTRHPWDMSTFSKMHVTKEEDGLLEGLRGGYDDKEEEENHDYNQFARSFLRGHLRRFFRLLQQWTPGRHAEYHRISGASHRRRSSMSWTRHIWLALGFVPTLVVIVIIMTGIFRPSYTHAPKHYGELRKRTQDSEQTGRANINNEKVFIATSIYDKEGELASGDWGRGLLRLIDVLGPENVFLSIYENDAGETANIELDELSKLITCNHSVVSEHLDTQTLPHVMIPNGEQRVKRIAFLAEVRNRALKPLEDPLSPAHSIRFDKLLFVNDVLFDPVDAANLLFSTNIDQDGRTQYRAACATDFIDPFKYYDTFATRDLEGHSMGVPVYPFFSSAGHAYSRNDVLSQSDAVRVRSCWGGMVAFDAKWFQSDPADTALASNDSPVQPSKASSISATTTDQATPVSSTSSDVVASEVNLNWHLATAYPGTSSHFLRRGDDSQSANGVLPLRFRSGTDPFWESSECCLINADLQAPRSTNSSDPTGIYMNPYVRVAYNGKVLTWLGFTRRFERVFAPFQSVLNWMVGLPGYNPRISEEPGEVVTDSVWVWDELNSAVDPILAHQNRTGSFQDVKRIAQPGSFCGGRKMLVLQEAGENGGSWVHFPSPVSESESEFSH